MCNVDWKFSNSKMVTVFVDVKVKLVLHQSVFVEIEKL